MKKMYVGIFALVLCLSSFKVMAQDGFPTTTQEKTKYVSENFVFISVKAVKIDENSYLKEIVCRDFKTKDNSVIAGFSIDEEMFTDNGKENDKLANDGIYTSVSKYTIESNEDVLVISDNPTVAKSFKFKELLEIYLNEHGIVVPNEGPSLSIDCDVESCDCEACGCLACRFGWGKRLNWCFRFKNCHMTLTVGK